MPWILILGLFITTLPAAFGGEASPAPVVRDASPAVNSNQGLGGLFAQSLQNLLRSGNLFIPNGQSATPIPSATPGEPEKFRLNFNNAPIDQVLKFMSDLTKKVVLKSDEIQGQVTIINPDEVTKDRALEIIDTAFMLKGFTFIETESTIVVIPASVAKQKGVNVETGVGAELGSRVVTRMVTLKYATPTGIKETLRELISENANMIADDRTKTLVITDTASNISRLEAIIKQLDKEGALEGVVVRVFRLRYANASEIARNLDSLLESIVNAKLASTSTGGSRQQTQVEVIADRTTNSLIVSAPEAALQEVGEFISKLDIPSTLNLKQQTFTLANGVATEVAQSLSQMAQSLTNNIYKPMVVADARTNTVIVSAYPEDMENFANLIAILDEGKSYEKTTEVFILTHGDAIVLSAMLKQLIGSGDSSTQGRYSYNYYYGGRNQQQDANEIKIIEDQRLNALIVTCRPADMPMVRNLIDKLDQPLPESKEAPKVFPIHYARATDIATIINNLFTENQQSLSSLFYYGGQQPQTLTGLTGKVKVIADAITNSIIVIAGTPRAFQVVEDLLKDLDRKAPDEFGTTKVFHLKNADAGYLGTQLTSLFQQDQSRSGGNQGFYWYLNQSLSTQSDQISQMIGNVRIVSETRTNSLLVTTSAQYFQAIQELINELDREISQVLVEVLIVEMVNVSNNQLGIDWPDNIPLSVEGNLNAPFSAINLDRASVVSSAKFSTILDFLGSDSNTRVLARPNIFTRDNQPAFVEVINRVPVITEFTITSGIAQQGFAYEEVGLKLTVTPHINDATTVTIDIHLENGQVLDTFFLQLNDTTKIPAFSRRTIDTTLAIHNRETAVLSGVIDTSVIDRENGVPGLRRIPVLGYLFKSKGKMRTNTELLTFITPYLVSNYKDRNSILRQHTEHIQKYDELFKEIPELRVKVQDDRNP